MIRDERDIIRDTEDTENKATRRRRAKDNAAEPIAESAETTSGNTYDVIVDVNSKLNIREKPDITSASVGTLDNKMRVTITDTTEGPVDGGKRGSWGKLISGKGWIALKFTKRA